MKIEIPFVLGPAAQTLKRKHKQKKKPLKLESIVQLNQIFLFEVALICKTKRESYKQA